MFFSYSFCIRIVLDSSFQKISRSGKTSFVVGEDEREKKCDYLSESYIANSILRFFSQCFRWPFSYARCW